MMGAGYISELGRGGTCVCVCVSKCVCLEIRRSIEDGGSKVSGGGGVVLNECVTERGGGRWGSCCPSCRVNP